MRQSMFSGHLAALSGGPEEDRQQEYAGDTDLGSTCPRNFFRHAAADDDGDDALRHESNERTQQKGAIAYMTQRQANVDDGVADRQHADESNRRDGWLGVGDTRKEPPLAETLGQPRFPSPPCRFKGQERSDQIAR